MDDKKPIVRLGHYWIVEEGEHCERLHRRQRLDVSQLRYGVIGENSCVETG